MAIASGGFHGLASKFDGTVWAWGANGGGQLCIGDFIQRNTPIPIPALNGAVVVAGSSADTVVLRPDGTVWTAGANFVGQLGNASGASFSNSNARAGRTGVVAIPTRFVGYHNLAILPKPVSITVTPPSATISAGSAQRSRTRIRPPSEVTRDPWKSTFRQALKES
jgi:alpha-tubulin suppressor-like RCC1 family protein